MGATYVYGIIPTGDELVFDVAGVDDHQDQVYSVTYRDLGAVVSASPLTDYRGLKRDAAVRYLVAHQRVVEEVMRALPLLPVKFGTVLPNDEWVRRLLRQGGNRFRSMLKAVAQLLAKVVHAVKNFGNQCRRIIDHTQQCGASKQFQVIQPSCHTVLA